MRSLEAKAEKTVKQDIDRLQRERAQAQAQAQAQGQTQGHSEE